MRKILKFSSRSFCAIAKLTKYSLHPTDTVLARTNETFFRPLQQLNKKIIQKQ